IIKIIFDQADAKKMTLTELAKRVGIAKSTLSRYKNGEREFPINDIGKYAKALDLTIEYMLGIGGSDKNIQTYTYLPTTISAGLPLTVDAITQASKIPIPDEIMGRYAGRNDLFVTKVSGDSMNNIMQDKSLIVVEPTTIDRLNNDDIVVYSNDYEYSVKHYYRYDNTLVFKPNSTNAVHKEQTYNINDNITIHGKVVLYIVNLD